MTIDPDTREWIPDQFDRPDCQCADCRTGGAYSYTTGTEPTDCRWRRTA